MNAIRTLRHFSPAIGMGFALFVVLSATSVCFFFFLYFGMFLVDIFASCANTQTASRSNWGEITKETRYPFFMLMVYGFLVLTIETGMRMRL